MSAPIVSYYDLTYEITLFRPEKEEKLTFGEHKLLVCVANKDEFQRAAPQIKGPPADDGFFYYLYAQPYDVGAANFIWLKDKEEAIALHKAIKDAEDLNDYRNYHQDSKCTFCGEMESECGGDHVDEMRQIQREAERSWRY